MKKLYAMLLFGLSAMIGNAQEPFEGTLKARSYEYHSKMLLKGSKGMLHNGARDVEMYVEGNRLGSWDAIANVRTIYDLDGGTIYTIFPEIETVVTLPLAEFMKSMTGMSVKLEPTDETKTIGGLTCRKYRGGSKTRESGVSTIIETDIWLCEGLSVRKSLAPFISGNTEYAQVGMRYVTDATMKFLFIKANSYSAYDIREIDRSPVPSEKFSVPAGYRIVEGKDPKALLTVYEENEKALEKVGKLPAEEFEALRLDIDGEWRL